LISALRDISFLLQPPTASGFGSVLQITTAAHYNGCYEIDFTGGVGCFLFVSCFSRFGTLRKVESMVRRQRMLIPR